MLLLDHGADIRRDCALARIDQPAQFGHSLFVGLADAGLSYSHFLADFFQTQILCLPGRMCPENRV